jgi:hypothetical protein
MASALTEPRFTVWGIDQAPYGPIELPTLVAWVKDERVTADTWIFVGQDGNWRRAADLTELQMFFRKQSTGGGNATTAQAAGGVSPRSLRRVKILAGLSDEQLDRFARFVEVENIPQWSVVFQQGDYGDTMYLILDGELRVRINPGGKETILATLSIGDFFGDISLFDHGPRSADVVANKDSLLVKLSAKAFQQLAQEAPDLAAPFLLAVGKTLTARIRADNKRYGDSVTFARAAG